ncbi:MAG: Na+:solute symporter, partial [Kordiimonas sp.]
FNIAHYALRPWPWILVALASIIVYPDLASIKAALPHVPDSVMGEDLAYSAMLLFLPAGALGLVVASLVSAYISTISTHLNWGASYAVNDFYNRFINKEATGKQQVMVGRVMTVLLMVAASLMALVLESALQAFQLLLSIGAGTGLLFILRWFWTRINVWSEISAMVLSFAFSLFFQFGPYANWVTWEKFVASVILTTIGWVAVTFLTSPTDKKQLDAFNAAIKGQEGEIKTGLYATLTCTAAIYGFLFTTGNVIFGDYPMAGILAAVTVVCGFATMRLVKAD